MTSETRTFPGVSREKLERLRESIANYAPLPPGDAGEIDSQGVKGSYRYDAGAQTLTLTLDEVPFFIPRAMVWGMIERAVQ